MRKPPYFDGMTMEPSPVQDIAGARVLALLGDSVTTDHISPGGLDQGRQPRPGSTSPSTACDRKDFNSYGSRRGNHEVMIRGTFANIRLRNQLLSRTRAEACRVATPATSRKMARRSRSSTTPRRNYAAEGTPLVVLGGKEYGSGSSRDWAAKGTSLLGVKAVIAESYERIHRSNLIGMGVLPLQFPAGETAASLGLDGTETFSISGVTALNDGSTPRTVHVSAAKDGTARPSSSTPSCASTPPVRPTTTATAASCSTCCARCCGTDPAGGAPGAPPGPTPHSFRRPRPSSTFCEDAARCARSSNGWRNAGVNVSLTGG